MDGDLLKCKLGYKVITWKKLLDGVHIDARHAAGVQDKVAGVKWEKCGGRKDAYGLEDCLKVAFPMKFYVSGRGEFGLDNRTIASLGHAVHEA